MLIFHYNLNIQQKNEKEILRTTRKVAILSNNIDIFFEQVLAILLS